MKRVTAALAMALLGLGCGASDEADTEVLGEVQLALSNTSWVDSGPLPQPSFFLNPAVASKRLNQFNFNVWTIALDGNTSTLKWSPFVSTVGNLSWGNVTGATNVSHHAATSWMGCGGVDANRNIGIGWIDFSGNAKVQVSNSSSADGNFLATPVDLGSGNLSFPPAIAYANGKLIMVTTKTAAAPNTSKRAYRFKWTTAACSGALGSWSSWINLPEGWFSGGPGAAASSSNGISVVGLGSDSCTGGPNAGQCTAWLGRISVPTMGSPSFTAGWTEIPFSTASFSPFTTIGMVNQNENGTSSARMVAPGVGSVNVWTATTSGTTSSAWSPLGNTNCPNLLVNATVALEKNGSPTFRVVSLCNPGTKMRFTSLTP